MSNKKYTCGSMFPSGCIIFTGDLPTFIPSSSFICDGNLDELLEKYGAKIDDINSSIDLTGLNQACYSLNPETATVKSFAQETINKLCTALDSITALQNQINNLDIGSMHVEIDLESLTPVGDPCAVAPNTYTLISILNLFKSEIISIKSQL